MKLIPFLVAAVVTGSASTPPPEGWAYVGMKGGGIAWKEGKVVRDPETGQLGFLGITYYARPKTQQAVSYSWVVKDNIVDCPTRTIGAKGGAYLNDKRQAVGTMQPMAPFKVQSDTPEAIMVDAVCGRIKVADAIHVATLLEMLDGLERAALPE